MMKYTISALAKKTGLSIHTLRFYEKEGLLRHVERSSSGRRVYGDASIGCLLAVLCLKQMGLSLPKIKEFMDETVAGEGTLPKRLQMMLEIKSRLQEQIRRLSDDLKMADFFIAGCRKALKAVSRGENPDSVFPFLTREGIMNFPFQMQSDGKLAPDMGFDFSKLSCDVS